MYSINQKIQNRNSTYKRVRISYSPFTLSLVYYSYLTSDNKFLISKNKFGGDQIGKI